MMETAKNTEMYVDNNMRILADNKTKLPNGPCSIIRGHYPSCMYTHIHTHIPPTHPCTHARTHTHIRYAYIYINI